MKCKRCSELEHIIQDIWWMAKRYADGRTSYAPETFNEAIRTALALGVKIVPDKEGVIARHGK